MKRWEKGLLLFLLGVWFLNPPEFIAAAVGRLEGDLYPVVGRLEIAQISGIKEGWSEIFGQFERLRDCDFHHMEWYLGQPNAKVQVQFSMNDRAQERTVGIHAFGPWDVQLAREDLTPVTWVNGEVRTNSFAEAYYNCPLAVIPTFTIMGLSYGPWKIPRPDSWMVITQIWPGTINP